MKYFAGLDMYLEDTAICVGGAAGRIVKEARGERAGGVVLRTAESRSAAGAGIGLEACSLTAWLHDGLSAGGLPAICTKTRQAHEAMKTMPNKTDRNDAWALAQIMRAGCLVARRTVLNEMRIIENIVRAILRVAGIKLGTPSRSAFAGRVRE